MLDDAVERRMRDRLGDVAAVDLQRALSWGRGEGVRVVALPVVESEVGANLLRAVEGALRGAKPYEVRRRYDRAERRLQATMTALDREDPPWQREELDEARKRFQAEPRDLSALLGGRAKHPIPDDNDLQIMVQARKLAPTGHRAHIISNDAHFWGYEDRLQAWWGLGTVRTGHLPERLAEWGG